MNQRAVFIVCVLAAIFLLCCACLLISIPILNDCLELDTGISAFNLLVDIAVGALTIWGLIWAATEFAEAARKSNLQLLPGRASGPRLFDEWEGFSLVKGPPFHLPGWYQVPLESRGPHVVCGLYLENRSSKAGRYVHVVVRILANPAPIECQARLKYSDSQMRDPCQRSEKDSGEFSVSAQFEESLVVYQSPVFVGTLVLRWDAALPDYALPENMKLDYEVYTLDGASHGRLEFHIEWDQGDE
jgi:hypothetical protein